MNNYNMSSSNSSYSSFSSMNASNSNTGKKYTARKPTSGISFGTGIGSSSILVIFVILCLVSFATLSIVSANADYKLSNKVLTRSTAYYDACNQAELDLANLDKTLIQVYKNSSDEDAYFATVGTNKSFAIPISDLQTLEISVSIQYPQADTDHFYHIDSWQVIVTKELEYDNTLNVIK